MEADLRRIQRDAGSGRSGATTVVERPIAGSPESDHGDAGSASHLIMALLKRRTGLNTSVDLNDFPDNFS